MPMKMEKCDGLAAKWNFARGTLNRTHRGRTATPCRTAKRLRTTTGGVSIPLITRSHFIKQTSSCAQRTVPRAQS